MAEWKRLTKRRGDGIARMSCSVCTDYGEETCKGLCYMHAVNRLAELEDRLGPSYNRDRVVQVVRCMDCRYYDHGICVCPQYEGMSQVPSLHFCGYGEKAHG